MGGLGLDGMVSAAATVRSTRFVDCFSASNEASQANRSASVRCMCMCTYHYVLPCLAHKEIRLDARLAEKDPVPPAHARLSQHRRCQDAPGRRRALLPLRRHQGGRHTGAPLEYSVHVLEPSVPSACINWKRWLLGKDTERSQEREVAVKAGVALPSQQSTPVNVVKTGMGLIFEPGGKLRVWNIRF